MFILEHSENFPESKNRVLVVLLLYDFLPWFSYKLKNERKLNCDDMVNEIKSFNDLINNYQPDLRNLCIADYGTEAATKWLMTRVSLRNEGSEWSNTLPLLTNTVQYTIL